MESCSSQRRHMRSLASSSSPSASFFPFLFSLFSLTLYIIPFSSPNPHSFPLCVNAVFLHHVFILPLCPELPSLFPLFFQKCHLLLFIFPKCPHQSRTLPGLCRYKSTHLIMTVMVSFNSKIYTCIYLRNFSTSFLNKQFSIPFLIIFRIII